MGCEGIVFVNSLSGPKEDAVVSLEVWDLINMRCQPKGNRPNRLWVGSPGMDLVFLRQEAVAEGSQCFSGQC